MPGGQLGDSRAPPGHLTGVVEVERAVRGLDQLADAALQLLRQHAAGGRQHDFVAVVLAIVGVKPQAAHLADPMALDNHFTVVFDGRHQVFLVGQLLAQNGGAAVDETLGEALVQGVG